MKKYIAGTTISLAVTLAAGGNARVSFTPLSDGSSVYYTEDEEIQWALEHHYKFGKLFRLEAVEPLAASPKKNPVKKSVKKTVEEPQAALAVDKGDSHDGQGCKVVTVSDMDAAKDYLAENFGVVRTKLKTEDVIKETAMSYGIMFKTL